VKFVTIVCKERVPKVLEKGVELGARCTRDKIGYINRQQLAIRRHEHELSLRDLVAVAKVAISMENDRCILIPLRS